MKNSWAYSGFVQINHLLANGNSECSSPISVGGWVGVRRRHWTRGGSPNTKINAFHAWVQEGDQISGTLSPLGLEFRCGKKGQI